MAQIVKTPEGFMIRRRLLGLFGWQYLSKAGYWWMDSKRIREFGTKFDNLSEAKASYEDICVPPKIIGVVKL